jgi:hypothetical protein
MVIEGLYLLKKKIINDKFNEKYSEIEVQNAMTRKKFEIEQAIGKNNK